MKKIFIFCLQILSFYTFAFEWPQEEKILSDSFYSYFGQLRGNTISSSLIFANPSEIKASEEGDITIIIEEHNDDSDFFPSTLGNAVIVEHKDNILTVYGNIDANYISDEIYENPKVTAGTKFGTSGNSGWQQGHSSLEFQVIDAKNKTFINPRSLMPRIGNELRLSITDVVLQNKNGKKYTLPLTYPIPTGLYKIYKKRQNIAIPYKTNLLLNGTVVDTISYDLLRQIEGKICVSGKSNYSKEILYPNEDLQLIGETAITHGKNTITIRLSDILGKEVIANYIVQTY